MADRKFYRHMDDVINMDQEGDELLNQVYDAYNQQGCGGAIHRANLSRFHLEPFVIRESPALGVRERVVNVRLDQLHPPNNEDELITYLIQDIRGVFDRKLERLDIHKRDRIYFQLSSNRLPHVFDGSGFTAGGWRRQTPRALESLNNMAKRLNSNQQFDFRDTFTLVPVYVQGPNVGW